MRNRLINIDVLENGICPYLESKSCVLNFLNLFGSHIGNQGLEGLKSGIETNKSLIYLNIGQNNFNGVEPAILVCDILANCL